MKVSVLGTGGREDSLVWAASKSPRVSEVLTLRANAGMLARPKVREVGGWPGDNAERIKTALWVAENEGAAAYHCRARRSLDWWNCQCLSREGLADFWPNSRGCST